MRDYPYCVVSSNHRLRLSGSGYWDRDKAQARATKEAEKAYNAEPQNDYPGEHWSTYVYNRDLKVFSAHWDPSANLVVTFTAEACGLRSL